MSDIRRMIGGSFFNEGSSQIWSQRIRAVLYVGVAMRLLVAFAILPDMPQMGDGPAYVRQASQFLAGTLDHWYFPPGTALVTMPIIGLLGSGLFAEHLAGMLIATAFMLSITWLARSLRLSDPAVFVATLLAAVYPHVVLSSVQISSLPLTAAAVALAIGAMLRAVHGNSRPMWIVAAFFCGLAVLARPGTLLLAPFMLAWAWFQMKGRRDRVRTLIFAKATLLLVLGAMTLPVLMFNAASGHGLTLSTNSEWNIFLANNRYTPDYKTGHFGQRALNDIDPLAEAYIRRFFSGETAENATRAEREAMLDSARAFMLQNPGRTLYRMSNRVRGFFGCDYTAARELQHVFGYPDSIFAAVMMLEGGFYVLVVMGWLVHILFRRGSWSGGKLLHLGILGVIIAPHVAAFALAKYHLPVVPLMICATAVVATDVFRKPDSFAGFLVERRNALIMMVVALLVVQAEHLYHLIVLR